MIAFLLFTALLAAAFILPTTPSAVQSRMCCPCELPAVFSSAVFVPPSVDRGVLLTLVLSSACNKIYKSLIMKYSYMCTYISITFQDHVTCRVCYFQSALLSECSFSDTQVQVGDHSLPIGNAYWVESNDAVEETSVQVGLNVNELTYIVFPNLSNGFSTTSSDE